jgi:HEAT repeat protein
MDKLVERQPPARSPLVVAPALAVQFFLIPLAVVAVTAAIYVGFRTLLADDRTAQEYLAELRHGGTERQWPAAYELSQLMADPQVRADRRLAPELVKAFEEAKDGDPRVRRYLALAIGRLGPPLPPDAIAALTKSLEEPDKPWTPDWFSQLNGWSATDGSEARITTIWALGSSGDAGVVPRLQPLFYSTDAGIRKMVAYALGALPGDAQIVTLRTALEDPVADVRWNAALALARHGNREGLGVLKQMLDRSYLAESVAGAAQAGADMDPAGDVMISSLQAVAALREGSVRPEVESISREDKNMRVRQAALEALKVIRDS